MFKCDANSFNLYYGFTTPGKSEKKNKDAVIGHIVMNILKGLSYIPFVGQFALGFLGGMAIGSRNMKKSNIIALISRTVLSLFPLVLPAIDGFGSIVYAVRKAKNGGENPLARAV